MPRVRPDLGHLDSSPARGPTGLRLPAIRPHRGKPGESPRRSAGTGRRRVRPRAIGRRREISPCFEGLPPKARDDRFILNPIRQMPGLNT